MSPSTCSQLPEAVLISLSQQFLCDMLSTSAPRPHTVSGRVDDMLTDDILERCYLPFATSTCSVSDNAKVSLLVEGLFRLLSRSRPFEYRPSLEAALEKGILARETKRDRRRKDSGIGQEGQELMWLKASGQRMRCQLAWMKQQAEV